MKFAFLVFTIVLLNSFSVFSIAHGGRTDYKGGHSDGLGGYHYHHGYPAHDHYDMDGDGTVDCPYNFDDKTNHENNNSGNNYTEGESIAGTDLGLPQKLTFWDVILMVLEVIGFSVLFSLFSVYLIYIVFGIIKALVEAILKRDISDSISKRIWVVILITDIVASVSYAIFLTLKKYGVFDILARSQLINEYTLRAHFSLLLGIFGIVFCINWLKSYTSRNDMFYAIFSMIGSVIMIICGILLLVL